MHEGEPLVPVEAIGIGEEVVVAPLREPPVCGEWSYDDSELEETRFVARRIDGVNAPISKATPIHPIRTMVDSRSASARAAMSATSGANSAAARAASSAREADPVLMAAAAPPRALRPTLEALRLAFEQGTGDTARAAAYASALERSGDAAGALAAIERAEAGGAEPFTMACARASALGSMLKYDDAAKAIKAAARLRPDDPEVHVQQGILACRRGRWKDAIEPLQRGVAGAPQHVAAHYYIGEALARADQLEKARQAYERAAELDPENWRALKGIGIILDRLGRSDEAAAWYRRARDAQRA